MDLSRLTRGEKIAAGSGALLFIFMFFTWFGVSVETGIGDLRAGSWNAWDSLELIRFVTLLGALSFLLILFRIIDTPALDGGFEGVSVTRHLGVFLGLIAAAGVAFGGYTAMEEEGTSFQDAADSFTSGPGGPSAGGGGQAPPPPAGVAQAPPPAAGGQAPPPPPGGGGQAPPAAGGQ